MGTVTCIQSLYQNGCLPPVYSLLCTVLVPKWLPVTCVQFVVYSVCIKNNCLPSVYSLLCTVIVSKWLPVTCVHFFVYSPCIKMANCHVCTVCCVQSLYQNGCLPRVYSLLSTALVPKGRPITWVQFVVYSPCTKMAACHVRTVCCVQSLYQNGCLPRVYSLT